MQEVPSLGSEDPLEEEMATHSSILAWKIPQAEKPGGLQSIGWQRVGHDSATEHTSWSRCLNTSYSSTPLTGHSLSCTLSLTHTHTHTFGLFFPLRDVCSETGSSLLLSLRVGPLAQVSAWVEIYFLNKWENDKMKRKTTEATLSDLGFLPKKL